MSLSRELCLVYCYVPEAQAEALRSAVFAAGAGVLGRYDSCAWAVAGQGQFRPLAGADPYSGTPGAVSRETELRLEFTCPQAVLEPVLRTLVAAHPYEEPAYGAIPLLTLDRGPVRTEAAAAPLPAAPEGPAGSPEGPADLGLYRHALLYQELHEDFVQDCDFYCRLLDGCRGPILELGAGNARVGRALARAGHQVWALDLVPEILELARTQARAEGLDLQLVQADMRHFDLRDAAGQPIRFAAIICPLNTMAHLLDEADLAACLAAVVRHLQPGGVFVPSLFVPDPAYLYRDPEALRRVDEFFSPSWNQQVEVYEQNCYHPVSQINHLTWFFQPENDADEPVVESYRLRVYHPREFRSLCARSGFVLAEAWQDYELAVDPADPAAFSPRTIMQTLVFRHPGTA